MQEDGGGDGDHGDAVDRCCRDGKNVSQEAELAPSPNGFNNLFGGRSASLVGPRTNLCLRGASCKATGHAFARKRIVDHDPAAVPHEEGMATARAFESVRQDAACNEEQSSDDGEQHCEWRDDPSHGLEPHEEEPDRERAETAQLEVTCPSQRTPRAQSVFKVL